MPIAFGFTNRADVATLSGGSWLGGAPLTNLQQPLLSLRARSVDAVATSTRVDVDLGTGTPIVRLVAIARHNLSRDATVQITFGTTPGGSDVLDTGTFKAWPAVYLPADLEWEDDNFWTGEITAEEAETYPISLLRDLGENVRARYCRVQVTDTANADGYVEIARLWLGPLWSPQRNFAFGAQFGWEARSITDYSLGGVVYSEQRPSARVLKLQLPNMNIREAYGAVLDAQRRLGTHGELWVLPEPTDVARGFKRNFLARFRAFDPISQAFARLFGTTIELEERL